MRIAHTADLHFSKTPDKLAETVRVTDEMLQDWKREAPDCIILAGDSVDEFDGRITLDSDVARAAISFVTKAAEIAPVAIIRGTKSHDRESVYIFKHLNTRFPVIVANEIMQVALNDDHNGKRFVPMQDATSAVAVFTLIPSLDKSYLARGNVTSVLDGNFQFREAAHDLFKGFGILNESIKSVPRIAVLHGMVTGAEFSTGQTATGEDLEFSLNDIKQLQADYVALGHVHKFQRWGNICYAGSPGRLNFGETEEKGYVLLEFEGQEIAGFEFRKTPTRRFALHSSEWTDIDSLQAKFAEALADAEGADVRFRCTIPEEEKHLVNREEMERQLLAAGAMRAKIEVQIIPKVRVRAAGISQITTLPEKVKAWGETVGEEVPERVLDIAAVIEGREVDELLTDALNRIGEEPPSKVAKFPVRKKAAVQQLFEEVA